MTTNNDYFSNYKYRKPLSGPTNKQQLYPLSHSVSEVPVKKFNHLWSVKNFSKIDPDVEHIYSPNFSSPFSTDEWCLKLSLNAKAPLTGEECVGVHLFLQKCEENNSVKQRRARYILKILDEDGKMRYSGSCSKHQGRIFITDGSQGHGYRNLAYRKVILDPSENILGTRDTLQVLCEITVFGDVITYSLPTLETDVYTKEEMNERSLSNELRALQDSCEKESDDERVLIETKDGVRVYAHKLLLSARSNVLKAIIEADDSRETSTNIKRKETLVKLDFNTAVIKKMLHFIYTDEVDGDIGDIGIDLFLAAEKYNLSKLKDICQQYSIETEKASTSSSSIRKKLKISQ